MKATHSATSATRANSKHHKFAHVDFKAVREAANRSIESVLSCYLPGGRWESNEYVALNPTRQDARPGSFKINRSGVWSDFATGETGGDLIDLAAYLASKSKIEAARDLAVLLNVSPRQGSLSFTGNLKADPKNKRKSANIAASPAEASSAPKQFPGWTAPNAEGKPKFLRLGEDGPRKRENEKRRHVYRQGGVPVKIKIMRAGGDDAYNIYRVVSDKGEVGWQARKPLDFRAIPYVAPFDVEGDLCWPEGEKDVETLSEAGLPAFTFGGIGDGLPVGCEEYVRDRDVVIFADNDEAGRKLADEPRGAFPRASGEGRHFGLAATAFCAGAVGPHDLHPALGTRDRYQRPWTPHKLVRVSSCRSAIVSGMMDFIGATPTIPTSPI